MSSLRTAAIGGVGADLRVDGGRHGLQFGHVCQRFVSEFRCERMAGPLGTGDSKVRAVVGSWPDSISGSVRFYRPSHKTLPFSPFCWLEGPVLSVAD